MTSSFIKTNILVLFIANSANIFAYLYQLMMGRYLSIEDFGVMNAFVSFGVIFSTMAGVIPYVITKYIIDFKNDHDKLLAFLYSLSKINGIIIVVSAALCVIFAEQITRFLNIDDLIPVYILCATLVTTLILSQLFGLIQGLHLYIHVSIKNASLAFLRFAFAYILVGLIGYHYNGALFSGVLANIIVSIWMLFIVLKHIEFTSLKVKPDMSGVLTGALKYALPVFLAWSFVAFFTYADIAIVKHFVDPEEAGLFASASIVAKIGIYLPGVLLGVLFPHVLQNTKDGKSSVKSFLIIMVMTGTLSFGFAGFVSLFPEFVITILFGDKFAGAGNVMTIIALAMAILAIINVIINFYLAKENYTFLYPAYISLILTLGMIYFEFNKTALEIASAFLYGAIFLLISFCTLLYLHYKKG